MRREPRVHDGQLASPGAAENQLAMGKNCGAGVGPHDQRRCAATVFRREAVATERQREGITQDEKRDGLSHLTQRSAFKLRGPAVGAVGDPLGWSASDSTALGGTAGV